MKGHLFVVSAASGTGKTTLTRELSSRDDRTSVSISHTTRPKRPAETDGVHYHFVTRDEFARMKASGEFLETATVYGQQYGTSRAEIERHTLAGRDVVLDIDWQGARQIRASGFPNCSIFLLPPTVDELLTRLQNRAQDKPEVIENRYNGALKELEHHREFDHLVMNDNLDQAAGVLRSIVQSIRRGESPEIPDVRDHATQLVNTRLASGVNSE